MSLTQLRKTDGGNGGSGESSLDLGELNAPRSAKEVLAELEAKEAQAKADRAAQRRAVSDTKQKQKQKHFDPCACFEIFGIKF